MIHCVGCKRVYVKDRLGVFEIPDCALCGFTKGSAEELLMLSKLPNVTVWNEYRAELVKTKNDK